MLVGRQEQKGRDEGRKVKEGGKEGRKEGRKEGPFTGLGTSIPTIPLPNFFWIMTWRKAFCQSRNDITDGHFIVRVDFDRTDGFL
jgi:hypothetical protein